jgi:hypothetical protein
MTIFQRIIDRLRGKKPAAKHPSTFMTYIQYAIDGIKRLGHSAPNKRDTAWTLVPGRAITNFGQRDWAFRVPQFSGDVLGVCYWSKPIKILLGSDGKGAFNPHTARHEAGHAIRFQAGDFGHHPAFRPIFQGWSDTGRRIAAIDYEPDDDSIAAVDFADGHTEFISMTPQQFASLCRGSAEYGPDTAIV